MARTVDARNMTIYRLGDLEPRFASAEHYVAPTAAVIGSVVLGHQASVWFGAVVRGDNALITIGDRSNIQDGCVLHVDPDQPLAIGANVTVGHKAMLHGCEIAEGSLIGINAVILNGARVGPGSIIGAGSLVAEGKQIPPGVLALGSPARIVRELTAEQRRKLLALAEVYIEKSERYRAGLVSIG